MFRATRVNDTLFEYVYASQFLVTIPCTNFIPIPARTEIIKLDKLHSSKDEFPRLSDFFLNMAKEKIITRNNLTTRLVRVFDFFVCMH